MPPLGGNGSDEVREIAYNRLSRAFWESAEGEAELQGLGAVYQDGRSGGWLVLGDTDEDAPGVDEYGEWLADLFRESVAAFPAEVEAVERELAERLRVSRAGPVLDMGVGL